MFNKVILVGNLTRDIELRYLQNGAAIGKSAIAVTRKFTNANGEKAEKTCFVDITFWGKTAEVANQYLRKGSKCLIEGSLELEQWQDNNGQNRQKHSVQVETMEMLGDNQNNQTQNNYGNYQAPNPNQGYARPQQAQRPQAPQTQNDKYEQDNSSIPF